MPIRLRPQVAILVFFGALFFSAVSPNFAQDDPPTSKSEGFFIGLSARSLAFKGDLDGRRVLWHFEKAFFFPPFHLAKDGLNPLPKIDIQPPAPRA